MIFSSKIPSSAVATIAKTIAEISGRSQVTLTRIGHVGAEGEEVAVGEVDELEDPVDERQADRAEGVDRAEREAVEPRWATSWRP